MFDLTHFINLNVMDIKFPQFDAFHQFEFEKMLLNIIFHQNKFR